MWRALVVAVCGVVGAGDARAEAPDEPPPPEPPPAAADALRLPLVVLENLIVTIPPAIYYWSTPNAQKEDWALHWNWPSWKEKLTSFDALVLDTNKFEANAIRHPLVGALTYQIGRTNRMSPLAATAMGLALSVFWEYFIEFKERPSINDLASNTVSGVLVGEPLFQIGLAADRRPSLVRHALGLAASPFHEAQGALGLAAPTGRPGDAPSFSAVAALVALDQSGQVGRATQLRTGLDLETFGDPRLAEPGDDAVRTGFAAWNRVTADITFGGATPGARFSGGGFRSTTTYAGILWRDTDDIGRGRRTFVGVGGGFDVVDRRLPSEWDKYAAFQLASGRAAAWWQLPRSELALDASVSGEVAMVQAHALGTEPRMTESSILLTRGYYYGTGVGAQVRAQLAIDRWTVAVESVAHQFWSFDEHSYGGNSDPRDLVDRRLTTTVAVGVRPFANDVRLEAFAAHAVREGTGDDLWRQSRELDGGLGVRVDF